MQDTNRVSGSPPPESSANRNQEGTATKTSLSRKINTPKRCSAWITPPVPLYLVPQALSAEIHKNRGSILEVHIRRTGNHQFRITLVSAGGAGGPDT
ncbi:MAG: hypothetical protein APR55_04750 [Methanolinea sp. SDB]|nr:MAG: hypothetical protein APR55_04750 [Methanolinea sp. SDB]